MLGDRTPETVGGLLGQKISEVYLVIELQKILDVCVTIELQKISEVWVTIELSLNIMDTIGNCFLVKNTLKTGATRARPAIVTLQGLLLKSDSFLLS